MTLESGTVYFFEHGYKVTVPETISLFGFSVSFYGILLLLAAVAGLFFVINETKKRQQDLEWNLTLIALVLIFGVLGARVYYVMFQWQLFTEEPLSVLNLRSGGLAYFGALFGAWFTVKKYCRKKGEDFEKAADVLSVGAAAAASFVWLGCALEREPIGRFYDGVFSVRIGTQYLPSDGADVYINELLSNVFVTEEGNFVSMHPVAFYGFVLSVLVFLIIMITKRFIKQSGGVFTLYLLLNAVSCFGLELFRASGHYIWGTRLPVNCVMSVVLVLAIAMKYLRQWWHKKRSKDRIG